VHSGDFKLDPTPVVGEPSTGAVGRDRQAGREGADLRFHQCLFAASGPVRSQRGPEIEKLIARAKGMVVATTFASNVARLKTLAEAARGGRSICLLGRAMRRMVEAAVETGVLTDFPPTSAPRTRRHPAREPDADRHRQPGRTPRGLGAAGAGKYLGIEMKEGDCSCSRPRPSRATSAA
jgi:ribonuclease J